MIQWGLDLWNELWNRAGSQGLDTGHDLPADGAAEKDMIKGPAAETGVPPEAGGVGPDDGGRIRREAMAASSRDKGVLRPVVESAILGALLLCVVVSSVAGAGAVFFSTVAVTWLLLPALVGLRNALDAGCVFTLISLGVIVVVAVAHEGPGALFP